MTDGPVTDPPADPPAPPAPSTGGDGGKTFTQAELDAIAGKSRTDGRAAAEKELLASLGVDNVDAAKAAIAAARAAEDANKTEAQKLADERDAAVQRATRAEELALRSVSTARLEGALRDAGINAERIPAALKLVDLGSLKVEGTEVSGVPEAVESLKAATPEWFGTAKPRSSAPDASGGDPPPVDYRTASADQVSADLYAQFGIR